METLGQRLKKLRNGVDLMQIELVAKINERWGTKINSGMLSRWESDRDTPTLDNARLLAKFFNVTLDYLITGEDPIQQNILEDTKFMDLIRELNEIPQYKEFIRKTSSLDSEQLKLLLSIIEHMQPKGE